MLGFSRWSRRRAARQAVSGSGLPQEVAAFIERVSMATRLRSAEVADVAAELASHFAEGLASGRDPAELLRMYGDPRRSARELRRSAIAKRGALDRALGSCLRWSGRGALGLAGLYAVGAVVLHFKEPVLALDAIAGIRAAMPSAGSEGRAMPLYMRALAGAGGGLELDPPEARLANLDSDVATLEFDEEARARAREALAAISERIAMLREVRTRPVLGIVPIAGGLSDPDEARFFGVACIPAEATPRAVDPLGAPALAEVLLPQLAMLRGAARWLANDAAVAAFDGRGDDLLADLEALAAMADHAEECPCLVSALVSSAIRSQLLATLVSAIENHADVLDDAALARIDALARTQRVDFSRALAAEGLFQLDVVQRCYSDDGSGDGVFLADAALRTLAGFDAASGEGDAVPASLSFLAGPLAAVALPDRATVERRIRDSLALLDEAVDAVSRREAIERIGRAETMAAARAAAVPGLSDPFSLLMPALGRTVAQDWRLRALRESAIAALSIERFHRASGRYPSDLAELREVAGVGIGEWFEEVRPWRYAVVDGRPMLYDCGFDRLDDRARTPPSSENGPGDADAPRVADGTPPRRLASLAHAAADADIDDGAEPALRFERRTTAVDPDSPPDPARLVVDDDPYATSAKAGDAVRVWWRSGAAGPARIVLAREPRPVGGAGDAVDGASRDQD